MICIKYICLCYISLVWKGERTDVRVLYMLYPYMSCVNMYSARM